MGKKSGKAGKAVPPAAPKKPEDADVADPGKMAEIKAEQAKTKSGKYGSEKVKPHKPAQAGGTATSEQKAGEGKKEEKEEEKKDSWIEIELLDERNEPVPGEKYKITLPDGKTVAEGTLDEKGWARVEGFEKGECKVSFPNLDKDAWKFVETDKPKGNGG
ncbi:MAG: hypothetical protein GWN67_13685 [Phycisphaerae bacterium]|nr:hypothetical protein [Phycisphaerae bacterium]NIP53155.1 hypothetical protein [Phycisphaerae bacterium]NIS52186.1 hypothetical protein [Phycisphaerae bacterium]NIU09720.1 hypothetical protein [Phycisphaerae bacterium]NIU57392.1 hypothetical protein [Phycisphaerae bacterium]